MSSSLQTVLAFDVGAQRIGVAEANSIARIAHPLTTISNTEGVMRTIHDLVAKQDAVAVVLGLPRGLQGQDTDQTRYVRDFAVQLRAAVTVPIHWQDEALTSKKAEAELAARKKPYRKEDVDALAATFILEDFLSGHSGAWA
jgi:putative Holliday junction resolvase